MIKSIFARPVFINPQAYLVIPQLANLSMLEPIDFTSTNTYSFESLGKVESKIISAKDEYILHVDLYESYGSCVLGEFYIGPATIGSIDDFTITTNGYITTIEVGGGDSGNIVYPGLIAAWSAKSKTNDDEDRDILKDLTGNGHDITLNGFAFSEMSGYGGYKLNLTTTDIRGNQLGNQTITHNKIILKKLTAHNEIAWIDGKKITTIPKLSWKVSNVKQFIDRYPNSYVKIDNDLKIREDGIYTIEEKPEGYLNYWLSVARTNDMGTVSPDSPIDLGGIEIELLPEYPDALVFDGVDDKGICSNIPILDKYTLICKRTTFIEENLNRWRTTICFGDDTSNVSELVNKLEARIYVDGKINNIVEVYNSDGIYFNTKETYNGLVSLTKGESPTTTNNLYLGILNNNSYVFKGAFYSAYLFDRSLDEQEIKSFIRKYIDPEYLLPSEIPTPDCYYDFSLGSNDDENRETIKDQSGNGNDAKAYNVAWADMSGYGGFALLHRKSYVISKVVDSSNLIYEDTKPGTRVVLHISGIPDGAKVISRAKFGVHFEASVDGTYIIEDTGDIAAIAVTDFTGECNIEITEEPQYPGALVLDGIDDYIALEAFTSGFKTMFMLVNPLMEQRILYDQRFRDTEDYAIFNTGSDIAYTQRNVNGAYINGVFNTTVIGRNLVNKKHLITVNSKLGSSKMPIIGANNNYNGLFSNMVIYKFLGFKEELTEEQIKAIIKKYNLLDGVDEIEVS